MSRIKGGKNVDQLIADVRSGLYELGELPSSARSYVAAEIAKAEAEEEEAKAEKKSKKKGKK